MDAVLTTFSAILNLRIDLRAGTAVATSIDEGRGIYFGITRDGSDLLVAARNRGMDGQPTRPGLATNVIYRLNLADHSLTPFIEHPQLADLHQIRAWGAKLFVILGVGSALAVFDIPSRRLESVLDLEQFVPPDLRRATSDRADFYHFNSLSFSATRLFILAHNWDMPSFALEFDLPTVARERQPRLVRLHRNIGTSAHDVVSYRFGLYVLDSGGERLLVQRPGWRRRTVTLPYPAEQSFPRGLAMTRDHILIGCGSWSGDRVGRMDGMTRILVLDRKRLTIVMDAEIGHYGNSSDILCLSEEDLSDRRPGPRRYWPRPSD